MLTLPNPAANGALQKLQGPRITNTAGEKLYFSPTCRAKLGVWVHSSSFLQNDYCGNVTGITKCKSRVSKIKSFVLTFDSVKKMVNDL